MSTVRSPCGTGCPGSCGEVTAAKFVVPRPELREDRAGLLGGLLGVDAEEEDPEERAGPRGGGGRSLPATSRVRAHDSGPDAHRARRVRRVVLALEAPDVLAHPRPEHTESPRTSAGRCGTHWCAPSSAAPTTSSGPTSTCWTTWNPPVTGSSAAPVDTRMSSRKASSLVVGTEHQALVHPAAAPPPSHPTLGNRVALVGEQIRREAQDVHPEWIGERDAPPRERGAVGTEGGGRVGVAAGEVFHALALEDLVAGRRAHTGPLTDRVGVRAEHDDVDQIVEAIDRMVHEQRAIRVEAPDGFTVLGCEMRDEPRFPFGRADSDSGSSTPYRSAYLGVRLRTRRAILRSSAGSLRATHTQYSRSSVVTSTRLGRGRPPSDPKTTAYSQYSLCSTLRPLGAQSARRRATSRLRQKTGSAGSPNHFTVAGVGLVSVAGSSAKKRLPQLGRCRS